MVLNKGQNLARLAYKEYREKVKAFYLNRKTALPLSTAKSLLKNLAVAAAKDRNVSKNGIHLSVCELV